MPTGVKKPKQKASVEGSVGKIATAVIAKLRNEIFTSLESLNKAIMKAVNEYNEKAFQKRDGSRSTVFNTQEKTYLRALPFIPYEVCDLPFPLKKNLFFEDIIDAAREIGPKTFDVVRRMYDEAKVKEQPTQTAPNSPCCLHISL